MSDGKTLTVLGISGSLRKASYNTATLRAAQELAPAGMTIETFDLAPLQHLQPGGPGVFQRRHCLVRVGGANRSWDAFIFRCLNWIRRATDLSVKWRLVTRLLGLPQKVGQLLPWRLVIDRRFHRLIYLFGREEHSRLHTGRAG